MKILAINGSYRDGGIIDQAVLHAAESARLQGVEVEIVYLRLKEIGFCTNCRQCSQRPGDSPGACVQNDDMAALVGDIEAYDAYILASPTNFSSVTAIFKRFMERLMVYGYWPWGTSFPVFRKKRLNKRAILITSSAAPPIFSRWFFGTMSQLKLAAKVIGAKSVGKVWIGMVAKETRPGLPVSEALKIDRQLQRLMK